MFRLTFFQELKILIKQAYAAFLAGGWEGLAVFMEDLKRRAVELKKETAELKERIKELKSDNKKLKDEMLKAILKVHKEEPIV